MNPNTDSGVASDSVGGTFSNSGSAPQPDTFTRDRADPAYGASGPSAGYNDNVEKDHGGEKKQGFLGKVKDVLTPTPKPGKTEATDDLGAATAEFRPGDVDRGRSVQANTDLNRE